MTRRFSLRPWMLATALLPMIGCMGASDDRLGSNNASSRGEDIDKGAPIKTTVQQERGDKGDTASVGKGTGRPQTDKPTETGGLGGNREGQPPIGPGGIGPKSSSTDNAGPK